MESTQQAPAPMSSADERTWSMLANLSILLNLITGILGPLAAIIIYFVYKERSRYVAFQSLQSFLFQLVFWIGSGALAVILGAIVSATFWLVIPLLCIPIICILGVVPIAALVYGVIGAVEASQGKDFEYWLVGKWAANILADQPESTQMVVRETDADEGSEEGGM